MAATVTAYNAPYGLDHTQTRVYLHGSLAFTTQTYTPGGILPTWGTIKDVSGQIVLLDSLNVNPDTVWIQSVSGSGFQYQYIKNTGKIEIFGSGSGTANSPAAVELTAITLPAGVLSDVIEVELEWVKA